MLRRWRREMLARLSYDPVDPQVVLMSYLVDGPVVDHLIEIERFVVVLLSEHPARRRWPLLRLSGYSGRRHNGQIHFGGIEGSRFWKDVTLEPKRKARRDRLDLDRMRLLKLALDMSA